MTKTELLVLIRTERAPLDSLVTSINQAALTEPALEAGWSPKDHLSHIAAWERMIVAHLVDGSDATITGMDAATFEAATLDELNDRLYEQHRDATVAEVLAEFHAAHEAIVALIEEMPEEQLAARYWADDAAGRTVLDKIAGDTYLHYREHAEWIGKLIGRKATAR